MQKPAANAGDAQTHATLTTIEQFNHAFNRREIDAVMALMTADCLFENTYPPPDGSSFKGQGAVRQAFTDFFASAPSIQFETEEIIVTARAALCAGSTIGGINRVNRVMSAGWTSSASKIARLPKNFRM